MKKQTKALVLNRETLRKLDLASVRGGVEVEVDKIDFNLTQGCVSNLCIPQEPVDPNAKYRLPKIDWEP